MIEGARDFLFVELKGPDGDGNGNRSVEAIWNEVMRVSEPGHPFEDRHGIKVKVVEKITPAAIRKAKEEGAELLTGLEDLVANFDSEVPIDVDHFKSEAAGWIEAIKLEAGRLLAKIRWNDLGRELIEGERFRFFSAWVAGDKLQSVSLVNFPAIEGLAPAQLSKGILTFQASASVRETMLTKILGEIRTLRQAIFGGAASSESSSSSEFEFSVISPPARPTFADVSWQAPTLSDFTDESFQELSDAEKRRIAGHFFWSDHMPPEGFGDLKLGYRRPSDGAVVPAALRAVLAVLGGARGGVDIPTNDQDRIKAAARRLLNQFNEESESGAQKRESGGDGIMKVELKTLTETDREQILLAARKEVEAEFAAREEAREQAKAEFMAKLQHEAQLKERITELYEGEVQLSLPPEELLEIVKEPSEEKVLKLAAAKLVPMSDLGSQRDGSAGEGKNGKKDLPKIVKEALIAGEIELSDLLTPMGSGLFSMEDPAELKLEEYDLSFIRFQEKNQDQDKE